MERIHQSALVISTLAASWLGMQLVHEAGHVLGCKLAGGKISKVVFHPLAISRTDYDDNPAPLSTVWAGPVFGVLLPLGLWGLAHALRIRGAFVSRFFAGFCLIANGAYIAGGASSAVGDSGEMLKHGSPLWMLWLFGVVTIPAGLWLWNSQGKEFGLGQARGKVDRVVAYVMLGVLASLIVLGLIVDGR